jgi:hypothetical protein
MRRVSRKVGTESVSCNFSFAVLFKKIRRLEKGKINREYEKGEWQGGHKVSCYILINYFLTKKVDEEI